MGLMFGSPRLTPEQCIELLGGHCWKDSGQYFKHAIQGAMAHGMDVCNHCDKTRKKVEQPKWKYEDEDA